MTSGGTTPFILFCLCTIYRVIHKSLRDFRTRLRNNQDRPGRKEHINRERERERERERDSKFGEILYLLICSFLPSLSWLLRSRVRKSRRDLWITLYIDGQSQASTASSHPPPPPEKTLRSPLNTRTAFFWVITQGVVVIYYRRFGTTYRSRFQGSRRLVGNRRGPRLLEKGYVLSSTLGVQIPNRSARKLVPLTRLYRTNKCFILR